MCNLQSDFFKNKCNLANSVTHESNNEQILNVCTASFSLICRDVDDNGSTTQMAQSGLGTTSTTSTSAPPTQPTVPVTQPTGSGNVPTLAPAGSLAATSALQISQAATVQVNPLSQSFGYV